MAKLLPDGPIDTMGLREAFLGLPEQLSEANAVGPLAGLPAPGDIDHVVVVAPGGARAGAAIVRVLAAPVARVPVIAHPGADLPLYVAARSLVLVASVDDHPAALAALRTASERGAHTAVIAPDGSELHGRAAAVDAALLTTPVALPFGRAAVGAVAVHALAVLDQLGQYGNRESAVSAAVAQLQRRRDELSADDDPMARLARRIGRTLPIVYGSDELGGVVAAHWKQQVNLDAKAASFAGALPDVAWDEVSGWGQHGDMTRQVFTLVTLRHDHEPTGTAAAMDALDELLDEVVQERFAVTAEGNGPLAQVLDLVLQGDLLSWHLAQELEIDPGPTEAITAMARATSALWSDP